MLHHYIQKGHSMESLLKLNRLERDFYMISMEMVYEQKAKQAEEMKKAQDKAKRRR